jgi:hypothetical protein
MRVEIETTRDSSLMRRCSASLAAGARGLGGAERKERRFRFASESDIGAGDFTCVDLNMRCESDVKEKTPHKHAGLRQMDQ